MDFLKIQNWLKDTNTLPQFDNLLPSANVYLIPANSCCVSIVYTIPTPRRNSIIFCRWQMVYLIPANSCRVSIVYTIPTRRRNSIIFCRWQMVYLIPANSCRVSIVYTIPTPRRNSITFCLWQMVYPIPANRIITSLEIDFSIIQIKKYKIQNSKLLTSGNFI